MPENEFLGGLGCDPVRQEHAGTDLEAAYCLTWRLKMQHPMVSTLSIAKLNRMPKDDFIAAIAPVFEELDDPWIAERAWAAAPFRDIESLHRAMIAGPGSLATASQFRTC